MAPQRRYAPYSPLHAGWVTLIIWLLLFPLTVHASDITTQEFSLDNGLNVVVIPNHRIPAVSHMLWFPNGGADDPDGRSGLTHFHEHIMFKGTPNFPSGEFESIIAKLGGDHNAFTTYDTTGYYVNIPITALPQIMELEADRIRGIVPSDDDIIKERQVIIEERNMRIENSPKALFREQLRTALFVHHPYGTPLIGWMHEMESLSKHDVLELHEQIYAVNNATLILAGDITEKEAKPLVEKYYGKLKKQKLPARNWNKEPPIRTNKRMVMEHPQVNEPFWQRSYIAPSIRHGETKHAIPLMVFVGWLGDGHTSYLYQQLVVKQKVATHISAHYSGFSLGPDTLSIRAVPASGVSMEQLEEAIDTALNDALTTTPKAEDIERAQTLLKAGTLYAREGLQGIAYIVGWLKMLGLDANYINQWQHDVDAATIAQMQEAARAVLNSRGHVTGTLLPETVSEAK